MEDGYVLCVLAHEDLDLIVEVGVELGLVLEEYFKLSNTLR